MRATGAGLGGLALASMAAGSATASGHSRLGTDGKWIVDENGDAFVPRGFAVAGLDFLEQHHPKSIQEVLELATGDDWHANTIRLPVTEWAVHDYGMDYVIDDLLRPAVDFLADEGIYAAIDFHLIRPYVAAEEHAYGMVEDGWADTVEDLGFKYDVGTDDLLTEFWSAVAPEFADDDHVLYELFNEPTLPNWWSTYTEYGDQVASREDSWLLWRDVAQPWVDLIRQHAPETPIVIGSPDWTSETQFAPQHPFEGENLIYSSHIYPDNGQPSEFDGEYGDPAEDVPVIVTEFGWDPDEEFRETVEYGTTSGWGEPFREWADSYENMGWFGWCFDDSWAPTYFDSPGEGAGEPWELKTGAEEQGWFMQEWLAEKAGTDVGGGDDDDDGGDDDGDGDDGGDDGGDGGDDGDTGGDDGTDGGDENPIAEANPSTTTASVGQHVSFQVEDTSGDSNWITDLEWDFDDGATGGGWWIQHSWDAPGTYAVALTATDNEGNSTTHVVEIDVS